jgi:predicted ester cyclase
MSQANKQLINEMYTAMNRNEVGGMPAFWTDDMIWAGPAGISIQQGVAQFEREVRQPMIHALPDKVGTDKIRVSEGNWIAATGTQKAIFAQNWLGIPATGKPVSVRYMNFWRVEDVNGVRKLAENWVLIDILGVLAQAGYDVNRVLAFVGTKAPSFFGGEPNPFNPQILTQEAAVTGNNSTGYKQIVADMYGGLNKSIVGNMVHHWFEDMVWEGPAGIGTKHGLDDFEHNYRRDFIKSFPDKHAKEVVRIAEGNWIAGAGYQITTFAQDWLGIPATGEQIWMRYMDFWRVETRNGETKLAENLVLIDILGVLEQAGYDVNKVLAFVGAKPPEFFS